MARLKVYSWMGMRHEDGIRLNNSQTTEVCAAPSMAALLRGLNANGRHGRMTRGYLKDYGSEWDPEKEGDHQFVKAAMAEPGRVFWKRLNAFGPNVEWHPAEVLDFAPVAPATPD